MENEYKRDLLKYALDELTVTNEAITTYKEALLECLDLPKEHINQVNNEIETLKEFRRQARQVIEEITGFKGV